MTESNGLAWSLDGRKLAMTWSPTIPGDPRPRGVRNLLVLDADSSETIMGIDTGDVAGPVAFGANYTILTAALNPDADTAKKDTIKIWDAATGKLLREIPNPPTGVHDRLECSADGTIVLGYIHLFKYNKSSHDNDVIYQKFRLWDVSMGQVISTSPEILPVNLYGDPPNFKLSLRGDLVLVWRSSNSAPPPVVYELQQTYLCR